MNLNLNNNKVRVQVIDGHANIILKTLKDITCENVACDECPCSSKSGYCLKSEWELAIISIIEDIKKNQTSL